MTLPEPGYKTPGFLEIMGCSSIAAAVVATIATVCAIPLVLQDPGADLLIIPLVVGGVTFGTIVMWVALRETSTVWSYRLLTARIRDGLEDREPVADTEFVASFPKADPHVVLAVREHLARFFFVQPEQIHPTDEPCGNLRFDQFEKKGLGSPEWFVAQSLLHGRILDDRDLLELDSPLFSGPLAQTLADLIQRHEKMLFDVDTLHAKRAQQADN